MEVGRIRNFNLPARPLFSGIYGPGLGDIFIGPDLRCYGIREILYLTFRSQGYNVCFYSQNQDYNFFSYRKDDLVELFNLRKDQQKQNVIPQGGKYIVKISSPFGKRRAAEQQQTYVPDDENEYAQIQKCLDKEQTYYRVAATVEPFTTINHYVKTHKDRKMVFIFSTAKSDSYEHIENILPLLDDLKTTYNSNHYQTKIIGLYSTDNIESLFDDDSGQLFRNAFFKEALIGGVNGDKNSGSQLYCVTGPTRDEYRNLLNRRRIVEGLHDVLKCPGIETASVRLSQKTTKRNDDKGAYVGDEELLNHYLKMPLKEFSDMVLNLDKDKAIDRLKKMAGTEDIIRQINEYVSSLRDAQSRQNSARFRPHLVFSGNPGTGKTTIARLLADILREEGLLERGHLIEATVGDLEGQYIGETRVKTQALCDRAKGGVLFIDEAYGLMSGSSHGNHVDYGKEAIEVLIQFMENNRDSLVILAGYKEDMENLIKNGNPGFMRRFNGKESFFDFKDYSPDALYKIFQRQISDMPTTPDFDRDIQRVITHMWAHKNARWGNASEMEKLAQAILSLHKHRASGSALITDDIPADKLRFINDNISVSDLLKEINDLVGLSTVKRNLVTLLKATLGQRKLAQMTGEVDIAKRNLNFIFTGNPGTGKTTVAGLMAKILYTAGLIDEDDCKVIKTGDLIKSGVGDTPMAVEKMFMDYSGKVIFIDEAYSLATHGSEAIDEITNCLTDKRFQGNQALILAGYTHEMDRMLAANRGLRSRFGNIWLFEDYSNEELWSVLQMKAERKNWSFEVPELCKSLAFAYFDDARRILGNEFSNVRKAEELFNTIKDNYYTRILEEANPVQVFRPQDFPNYTELGQSVNAIMSATQSKVLTDRCKMEAGNAKIELVLDDDCDNIVSDANHFNDAVGLVSGSNGMGTGFFISKKNRLVITASHVIEDNEDLLVLLNRGSACMGAKVIWNNPVIDMAVLQTDSIPDEAKCFLLDTDVEKCPEVLTEIIHCGYVKGTEVSKSFQTYIGTISSYDSKKNVGTRCFDAILSGINATNGCSGGPVICKETMKVIGILQGGFENTPARIISDIHQLFTQSNLIIRNNGRK